MFFDGLEKPLVMNSTNGQIIAALLGSEESDDWIGQSVQLYTDPSITYNGKLVGGIRVREAGTQPPPQVRRAVQKPQQPLRNPPQQQAAAPEPEGNPFDPSTDDDNVPF